MQLEDYFEFEKVETKFGPAETIRLKGRRITLEDVIEPFLQGMPPEQIAQRFSHPLPLEQVYATITYYLHNKEAMDHYLTRGREIADSFYEEHRQRPPDAVTVQLREAKARREAAEQNSDG
jgi:uncharacterized protein (DUF433 family)